MRLALAEAAAATREVPGAGADLVGGDEAGTVIAGGQPPRKRS
jgi:hypothetical protein